MKKIILANIISFFIACIIIFFAWLGLSSWLRDNNTNLTTAIFKEEPKIYFENFSLPQNWKELTQISANIHCEIDYEMVMVTFIFLKENGHETQSIDVTVTDLYCLGDNKATINISELSIKTLTEATEVKCFLKRYLMKEHLM